MHGSTLAYARTCFLYRHWADSHLKRSEIDGPHSRSTLLSTSVRSGPTKPRSLLTRLAGAALSRDASEPNDRMTLRSSRLGLYLSGRAAARAAKVPSAFVRALFSSTFLVASMWLLLLLAAAPHWLPSAAAVQVLSKCEAARNATSECLAKEATRLREMAANEKHWFVNSSVGIESTANLLGHFCREYNKSSACLCHVTNQCSEDNVTAALATVQVAHFGVFANLCRHDNITRELVRRQPCYGRAERVVKQCFAFCWHNKTCASCRESMDCTKKLLGASCQRDSEFARVLELLLRIRESFVDAHGCYPDSSAPLELSFRTNEQLDKCAVIGRYSSRSLSARSGLTSGGDGGGGLAILRAPTGTEFVAVAASVLLSALSSGS